MASRLSQLFLVAFNAIFSSAPLKTCALRNSIHSPRHVCGSGTDSGTREAPVAGEAAGGGRPAPLWSAPAERSDDGVLAQSRMAMEPTCSWAQPLHNKKRRGATLPAALQNACCTI